MSVSPYSKPFATTGCRGRGGRPRSAAGCLSAPSSCSATVGKLVRHLGRHYPELVLLQREPVDYPRRSHTCRFGAPSADKMGSRCWGGGRRAYAAERGQMSRLGIESPKTRRSGTARELRCLGREGLEPPS